MFDIDNPFTAGNASFSYMELLKYSPISALNVNKYLASCYIDTVNEGKSGALLNEYKISRKYHNALYNDFYRTKEDNGFRDASPVMEIYDAEYNVHPVLKLSLRDNIDKYRGHFLRTAYKKVAIERWHMLLIIIEAFENGRTFGKYER